MKEEKEEECGRRAEELISRRNFSANAQEEIGTDEDAWRELAQKEQGGVEEEAVLAASCPINGQSDLPHATLPCFYPVAYS